jgi:hypothetical protein
MLNEVQEIGWPRAVRALPLALPGILADQAAEVAAAYAPFATKAPPVVRGDWIRLDGLRR